MPGFGLVKNIGIKPITKRRSPLETGHYFGGMFYNISRPKNIGDKLIRDRFTDQSNYRENKNLTAAEITKYIHRFLA